MPHQPTTHLWQVDALGGLELIRADLAAFAFASHAHAEYFVTVTEGGSGSPSGCWPGGCPSHTRRSRPGSTIRRTSRGTSSGCTA